MPPQLDAVADESTKAELNELVAHKHVLQATRRRLVMNFAANSTPHGPASLGDEDDMDFSEKPPKELEQAAKAPQTGDADKTALLFHAIMSEADQQNTNTAKAAGASAVQK